MRPSEAPVPADAPATVSSIPVRFGVLDAAPLPPATATPQGTTDGYSFRLVPLRFAYVVLADEGAYWVGRTNVAGYLFVRQVSAAWADANGTAEFGFPPIYDDGPTTEVREANAVISWDADAPVDDGYLMSIGLVTYFAGVFWSYDEAVWREVIEALDRNHAEAFARYGFTRLREAPRPDPEPGFSELPLLSALERRKVAQLLLTDGKERYYLRAESPAGGRYPARPSWPATQRAGAVFDVTPKALRALYAVEWTSRYASQLRKATLPDWGVLTRVESLVAAYVSGSSVPELDSELLASILERDPSYPRNPVHIFPGFYLPAGPEPPRNEDAIESVNQLREYAVQCARAGVDRGLFATSVAITTSGNEWMVAAQEIHSRSNIRHPCQYRVPAMYLQSFSERAQSALVSYFDIYVFAKRQIHQGVDRAILRHRWAIEQSQEGIARRCREIIARDCPNTAFHAALSWHLLTVDDEGTSEAALLQRYLDMAVAIRYPFWTEIALDDFDAWVTMAPVLKWAGKSAGKFASVMRSFFQGHVKAFGQHLKDATLANRALNYMFRYHAACQGNGVVSVRQLAESTLRKTPFSLTEETHFHVDMQAGTIWFDITSEGRQSYQFRFLTNVEEMPLLETLAPSGRTLAVPPVHPRLQRSDRPARAARYVWAQDRTVRSYSVEMPADPRWAIRAGVPVWLKTFADALTFFFAVEKIVSDNEHAGAKTYFDLANGTLGLVGTFDSVYQVWRMARRFDTPDLALRAEWVTNTMTNLGRASAVLSSGLDLYEGIEVLSGQNSALQATLRRGESAVALAIRIKGGLQIASGMVGGVTLAYELVGLAVAPPVAIGAVCLGVIIFAVSAGISIAQSGQSDLQDFFDKVREVREREFQRPVGDSTRPDPGRRTPSLTQMRLQTLYAHLHPSRPRPQPRSAPARGRRAPP